MKIGRRVGGDNSLKKGVRDTRPTTRLKKFPERMRRSVLECKRFNSKLSLKKKTEGLNDRGRWGGGEVNREELPSSEKRGMGGGKKKG